MHLDVTELVSVVGPLGANLGVLIYVFRQIISEVRELKLDLGALKGDVRSLSERVDHVNNRVDGVENRVFFSLLAASKDAEKNA